jgi:hypothetical protein
MKCLLEVIFFSYTTSKEQTMTIPANAFPRWEPSRWHEMPENPLIKPLSNDAIQGVVGDPQIILPGEFDALWHMFVWSNQGTPGFAHFSSPDGKDWSFVYNLPWRCGPFYISHDGGRWLACYTHYGEGGSASISARTSPDLRNWSDPITLLKPEFDWELEGERKEVRNPNLCIMDDGRCLLFYSGGTVWMNDMNFEEPKYIGLATAKNPLGPYVKHENPVILPDKNISHRNYGAGALKVYGYGKYLLGMLNGVSIDADNHSRSSLSVLLSENGIDWQEAPYNPIIVPDKGWKKALVYQLDLRHYNNRLYLYYNARDEWLDGKECIGASVMPWTGESPRKLWKRPRPTA